MPQSSSFNPSGRRRFFYLLALVALVGGGVIAAQLIRPAGGAAPAAGPMDEQALARLGDRALGSADAPLTIVEFADFQCGGCAMYAQTQVSQIKGELVEEGLVRYVFMDFPLEQHPHAVLAARGGRCAAEQDAFWPYHDRVFEQHASWAFDEDPTEKLVGYAAEAGADSSAFAACLGSDRYTAEVEASHQLGRSAGVRLTPSLVVNGRLLDDVPSAAALRRMALEVRARSQSANAPQGG